MRVRWRYLLPPALVGCAAVWWMSSTAGASPPAAATPPAEVTSAPPKLAPPPASAAARGPYTAEALAQRRQQLALWRQRLAHAQRTLAAYEESTRYPYESRPAIEHLDRWQAHPRIASEMPLLMPGGAPTPGVRIRTSQQAVFASARDTVALTVEAVDDEGKPLALRILSSNAHAPADSSARAKPQAAPNVVQPFVDDGTQGDAQPGDGVWTTRLAPAAEGFAGYSGVIRTELAIQVNGAPGHVEFDVVYAPEVPATWTGPVREALEDGSLDLYLGAQVAQPGRYVISGRVDDANGKPFAFVTFNDELGAGAQQVKLTVYGKLVRDAKPAFPLTLHDVDGFLLRPRRLARPGARTAARRRGTRHAQVPAGLVQRHRVGERRDAAIRGRVREGRGDRAGAGRSTGHRGRALNRHLRSNRLAPRTRLSQAAAACRAGRKAGRRQAAAPRRRSTSDRERLSRAMRPRR